MQQILQIQNILKVRIEAAQLVSWGGRTSGGRTQEAHLRKSLPRKGKNRFDSPDTNGRPNPGRQPFSK
jgi:hypothetical protein